MNFNLPNDGDASDDYKFYPSDNSRLLEMIDKPYGENIAPWAKPMDLPGYKFIGNVTKMHDGKMTTMEEAIKLYAESTKIDEGDLIAKAWSQPSFLKWAVYKRERTGDVKELVEWLKLIRDGKTDAAVYTYIDERPIRRYVKCEPAERLACGYLIGGRNGVNWENVIVVEAAGFEVFALERDSFGWVIGGIRIKGDMDAGQVNGILSFG